ncbi:MAG: shikimate dehydrogenase [Alphaproteobacteria bacterium]|nr:shikimate dehydrogenase [Alphaproteobacteria bacterium]
MGEEEKEKEKDVKRAGVIGFPVAHSLSPKLHGFWLKKYNITGKYTAIEAPVGELHSTLKRLQEKGFRGVNITLPHKEEALRLMDAADDTALRAGAVNTVVMNDEGMTGSNTDIFGFMENIREHFPNFSLKGKHAAIVGAGGAARAVCVALEEMGAHTIRIINRSQDKAEALAKEMSGATYSIHGFSDADKALEGVHLLVNASPLGMRGQPALSLPLESLSASALVTDIVYTPLITPLLFHASQRGNPVLDGLGMLLHQARPGFKAWFGTMPEATAELREALLVP